MDQVSVKWKSKFEAVKINSKLDICDKKDIRLFPLPCSCQNKWLSLRCKDVSGFFELIVLIGYVKWIFLLSIALSLNWAENWKLSLAHILLRFSSVRSNKFRQQVFKLGRREAFNFLIFHTICFNVAEKSVHISNRFFVCVCTFLLVD